MVVAWRLEKKSISYSPRLHAPFEKGKFSSPFEYIYIYLYIYIYKGMHNNIYTTAIFRTAGVFAASFLQFDGGVENVDVVLVCC